MDLREEEIAYLKELAGRLPRIAEILEGNLALLEKLSPKYQTEKVDLSNSAFHENVTALNLIYGDVRLIESHLARLLPDYKSHLSRASDPETYLFKNRRNNPGGYPTE